MFSNRKPFKYLSFCMMEKEKHIPFFFCLCLCLCRLCYAYRTSGNQALVIKTGILILVLNVLCYLQSFVIPVTEIKRFSSRHSRSKTRVHLSAVLAKKYSFLQASIPRICKDKPSILYIKGLSSSIQ